MSRARLAVLVALAALTPACTFEDGAGFATLRSTELAVAFEPGARLLEGAVLTAEGRRVRVESFRLRLGRFELEQLQGNSGVATFDPAAPPPGYSLCHGGHCHADDGSLVSYAEVEASRAGGGARFAAVVTCPVERDADLLEGLQLRLDRVEPSRELPSSSLRRAVLFTSELEILGVLEGEDREAPELPFAVRLDEPIAFEGALDVDVSRDGPENLRISATLGVDGTLFDRIDWGALAAEEVALVSDPDAPLARALLENLSENPLQCSVR